MKFGYSSFCVSVLAVACGGCATANFDVPRDAISGQPTVNSIVKRLKCEVENMVRDDRPDDVRTFHRKYLMNADVDIEVYLSLEVNDTGGLAPSLSYIDPLKLSQSFTLSAAATLSKSRDTTFSEYIMLSAREIYTNWKSGAEHPCDSPADTNLAGELGLSEFVAMATTTENREEERKLADKGAFGGSIQFTVTKNLSSIGPLWTLTHFKGPGALGSLSEVNTDKITIAFARGSNAGKRLYPIGENPKTHELIQQILTGSISSQLTNIQSKLQ